MKTKQDRSVLYFVSIRDHWGTGAYRSHEVPEEVWQYILQLESAIKHPELSRIKEAYPRLK